MWTQIFEQNIAYQSSLSSAAASSSWPNLISTIEMKMTKFNLDHWEDTLVPSAVEMLVDTSNKDLFLSAITALIYSVGVRFGYLTWLHTRFIFLGHCRHDQLWRYPRMCSSPCPRMGYRLSPVETLCLGTICHTIAAAASRNAAARQRWISCDMCSYNLIMCPAAAPSWISSTFSSLNACREEPTVSTNW